MEYPNPESRPGNPEQEPKPAKPFASLAQARRCDALVETGTITKEVFERDLLATDIESIPWRKGPAKEEDGTQEAQDAYRAMLVERKGAIVLSQAVGE